MLTGVKLTVLSLARHWPDLEVAVHTPGAPPGFRQWLSGRPNVSAPELVLDDEGWNVKPSLLLHHLAAGRSPVIWIDSDVVLMGDLATRLAAEPIEALVGAEDVWWGRAQGRADRTEAWGFTPGRILPRTFNTGIVQATSIHVPVLEAWRELLRDEHYRRAQTSPWADRPLHLVGDQEVLTALLGAAEWAHVDVRLLRRGLDIAQCYSPASFAPSERARLALERRAPVLVHAMGPKPWVSPNGLVPRSRSGRFWAWVDDAHRYLSPYTWVAATLAEGLGDEDVAWLHPDRGTAWLAAGARHDPVLQELPLSIIDTARCVSPKLRHEFERFAKKARGVPRRATS
jgi:hypothetical protein